MLAVFVNCFAVILGSLLGLLFSKKISDKMSVVIQDAAGIITLVLGIQMAFKFNNIIYLSLSLFIGGLVGSLLDLDGKILNIGNSLEKLLKGKKKKSITEEAKDNPGHELSENQIGPENRLNFGAAFLNASCLSVLEQWQFSVPLKPEFQKIIQLFLQSLFLTGLWQLHLQLLWELELCFHLLQFLFIKAY